MKIAEALVKVARQEVVLAAREKGGNNRGPDLQRYFDSDDYDPNGDGPGDSGYAWCAAAVCYEVKKAMELAGGTYTFKRPRTPAAFGFITWSKAQDNSTKTVMKPKSVKAGDIVVLEVSHIGVALTDSDNNGNFRCAEGNTNGAGSREGDGFYEKTRNVRLLRASITFTV